MFGRSVTLFTLLGFKVQVDASWVFLALLITWSLAVGFFPRQFEGLDTTTYWILGVAGAVGLFFSIIFHEMSHSLVARRYGLPMRGITLFIFGGVAHMEREPDTAKTEFLMAIAGPISSFVLGAIFYVVGVVAASGGLADYVVGLVQYLAFINVVLAVFNLVPAFPLDGGRVLRAVLWHWKGSIRWATRIAARAGSMFGWVLIALGVTSVLMGNFIGGMWWFLIGMFVRGAANLSYRQLLTRQLIEGEPVSRFMVENPLTVGPDLTVQDLVEHYIYRYHHEMFPVTDDARLIGCVGTKQVKEVPRKDWGRRAVGDVVVPCSDENTIDADVDAVRALSRMSRSGNSRLMVTEGERLVGIVALKDMLRLLSLKMDLEEDAT